MNPTTDNSKAIEAAPYLSAGFDRLSQGNIHGAITCFDQTLEIHPENLPALQGRILCKVLLLPDVTFEERLVLLDVDIRADLSLSSSVIDDLIRRMKRRLVD